MPSLIASIMFALAALASPLASSATPNIETSALGTPRLEIVVVEEPNCLYCALFRRDLYPAYAASPRSREVPMRFISVAELSASRLSLTQSVNVVPTILVLADGTEIGRIPGYATTEIFFSAINALLPPQH
jgi:thioredoxin-related protein